MKFTRLLVFPSAVAAIAFGSFARAEESAPAAPPPPPPAIAAVRLTLDDAIASALRKNAQLKVTEFGRGIARANVLAEYGHFDPAITFRRSYSESEAGLNPLGTGQPTLVSKDDEYSLSLDGTMPWGATYSIGGNASNQRGSFNYYANQFVTFGGVSVTQPLLRGFGFGAALANLRIAKADRGISDWDYRQAVIDTVTNVIVTYNNLAEARENLRIAIRARDLAAQLVRDNERRNNVGYLADADVTQARAEAATLEESILLAQRAVKSIENQLRALIGDTGITPDGVDFAVDPLVPITTPATDGAADLHRALELRPDYQAAKLGIVKRRATRSLAFNQMLPRLDFVGSYGYNGIDSNFATSRQIVRDRDHRAYSAGMVVSVPLTFTEGRGRARAAKLALQQAEADLGRLEQDIAVSVANAIGQLETAGQRVAATETAYALAQQALNAEEKRFKAGTSNTFLVLQFQEKLIFAETARVRSLADEHRALAAYEREIGSTLLTHHLKVE
jgi:outer membrane protein TolC